MLHTPLAGRRNLHQGSTRLRSGCDLEQLLPKLQRVDEPIRLTPTDVSPDGVVSAVDGFRGGVRGEIVHIMIPQGHQARALLGRFTEWGRCGRGGVHFVFSVGRVELAVLDIPLHFEGNILSRLQVEWRIRYAQGNEVALTQVGKDQLQAIIRTANSDGASFLLSAAAAYRWFS